MEVTTVRLEAADRDRLQEEAEEQGFESMGAYIRHLIEHRGTIIEGAPVASNGDVGQQLAEIRTEVSELGSDLNQIKKTMLLYGTRSGKKRAGRAAIPSEPAAAPEPRVASVDELDLQGAGDVLAARQAALTAVYERLQELGEATKQELLEVVDAEAVGYASADSFWSNIVGGEGTLSKLPGVRAPEPGHGAVWRYSER